MSDEIRHLKLDPARVVNTIERLCRRIEERFPDANLIEACNELLRLGQETRERASWIGRPMVGLRIATGIAITGLGALLFALLSQVKGSAESWDVVQFVGLTNAAMNNIVLLAAVVFFLFTVETRVKRRRALAAIHELRSLAHVVDMHQLTKDPDRLVFDRTDTRSSPSNELDAFEMSRYLDYCSEILSLIGKIASVYSLRLHDDVAVRAVNEVERLTAGLSQKIFQKIMIIHGTLDVRRHSAGNTAANHYRDVLIQAKMQVANSDSALSRAAQ